MEPVRIQNTFGAAYIGAMVMTALYGLTTLQTYMYFIRYPKDPISIKRLVSSLWVLDTLHVVLVCHAMYHYLIVNYANPAALDDGIWTLYVSVGVNVLIAFVTQCFFTKRVHSLSGKKWWLTGIISLVVFAHLCFGMETMAELFIKKKLSRLSEITLIAALPFAVFAVLSDILITATLCVLLYNSRTGFKSTNTLLNYLIIYAINRCLLTSIVAVVETVTFAVLPRSFWFLGIDFVIGKLYANSLLATLNTRSALRGRGEDTEASSRSGRTDSLRVSSLRIGPVTPSMASPRSTHPGRLSMSVHLGAVHNKASSDATDSKSVGSPLQSTDAP